MIVTLIIVIIILLLFILKVYIKFTIGINKCSRHLVGKVIIVTGANSGIGYETAKDLAERGARVILACRDQQKGDAAVKKIKSESGSDDVHYRHLNLASFASIRTFAEEFIKIENRLDVFINNAGVFDIDISKTEDDLFIGMQTNHFGPFLLTKLLLPLIISSAPSRIINVSSTAYRYGKMNSEDWDMETETRKSYSKIQTYVNSKLFNVWMTIELARQLKDTGVTVNCLHPGVVKTKIVKSKNILLKLTMPIINFFIKTAWEGAQTSIYLAVSPEVDNTTGFYFCDCRMKSLNRMGRNADLARKLWEESERIIEKKLQNNTLNETRIICNEKYTE